ncbi:nucleotide exchange factor GrpE [Haloplanus sp. C73]|uniref:nucleotide exchange factor GrpE n=1 Tax=Haloplanus sp. C73 TaxID=3421641 RepID=UPI003EB9B13E
MSDHDSTADDGQREENDPAADTAEARKETTDQHASGGAKGDGRAADERARSSSEAMDDEEAASEDSADTSESDGERQHADEDVSSRLDSLEAQFEQTQERLDSLETQLADYERRNDREHEELKKYAVEDLAAEMLKVKDSLMDAIEMEELEDGTEQRLRIVGKQFDKVLTSGRLDRIEPEAGEPYDDDRFRMVSKEATDEYEPNHVVRVQESGYQIQDRVIRPARVVVATAE